VREQFEQPENAAPKEDKGKGKGKGKAVMMVDEEGRGAVGVNGWEDPAEGDDEELYGE
jgi:hypothetical protein